MHVKVLAQVKEVSLKEEYAKKPNGLFDYDKKIEYFESGLQILHNPVGVIGHFTVRERLEIGSIHEIFLNTEKSEQVVETQAVTLSQNPVLKL